MTEIGGINNLIMAPTLANAASHQIRNNHIDIRCKG